MISERFAIVPYFFPEDTHENLMEHSWLNSGNSVGIHGRYSRKPMKISWKIHG